MTDYNKTTNFGVKDGLSTGDTNKLVRGSEFDTEFDNIQTAVATKADSASPTLTGTATAANVTVNGTFKLADTSDDHYYTWAVNELVADRTVTWPLLTGNDTLVFEAHTATLTNKTIDLTSNTLQGSKTEFNTALESDSFLMASDLLDEDTMTSNSATAPASQQSIKAYVDAQIAAPGYVDTTGVVNANEFARFNDSNTLEALTAAEVRTALNVENGADVTDTTNVTAAGALMDSEVTSLSGIKTLTVPDNTTISTFGATLVDDTSAAAVLSTLGITSTVAELNYVDGVTSNIQTQIDAITTGAMVFLDAATASTSAAIEFTSATSGVLDDTYEEYIVIVQNAIPDTDAAQMYLRSSNSGGSPYDSGASDYTRGTTGQSYIHFGAGTGSDANEMGISGWVSITNAGNAGYTYFVSRTAFTSGTGNFSIRDDAVLRAEAAIVNAIQFSFSSGNIESGTFAIYGVKRS